MTSTVEIDPNAPRAPQPAPVPPPWWAGGVCGLLAGAVAITVGTLVAGLGDTVHPLDAVGSSFIDRTPLWLRERAIDWFGTNDKRALRVGMVAVLAVVAVVLGIVSRRRVWMGATGVALFGVIGVLAALDRPKQGGGAVVPPILGAIAGVATLVALIGALEDKWLFSRTPHRSLVPLGWDRRRFLAASGTAAAVAVVAGASAAQLERRRVTQIARSAPDQLPRPAAGATATTIASDELVPGTPFITPNGDFYRIDTALSFPHVNVGSWSMTVHGMVGREVTLTYDELLKMPQIERMITLCCVSNPVGGDLIGNAVWQGVLLKDVLDQAGIDPAAEQVFMTSVDGFTCGFPVSVLEDGRDCMIAVGMNGEPLPLAHGFPARVVVPGLYGYVSACKWLSEIELTTWRANEGYWVPRGWSRDGPIKTQSRIDVPKQRATLPVGMVTVAGVAWAQHRGVAKVEVRVDAGPWTETRIGDGGTDDSWVQWLWDWDAPAGDHRLQVRATDKTGATQVEEVADVAPNGATGYHTRRVTVG